MAINDPVVSWGGNYNTINSNRVANPAPTNIGGGQKPMSFKTPDKNPSGGGGGGGGKSKDSGSVKDKFARTAKGVRKLYKPSQQIYNKYTKPAYEEAYQAAENMGVSPSIYGQYAAAKRQQEAQFNRMGMGQTGAAMAANQALTNQYMDAAQQAQAQANAQRFQAFQGLADQANQYGSGAISAWQDAANRYNQQAASRQQQRDQQDMAERQAMGGMIGGVADLGLTLASGGAYAPIAAASGGLGGMFGAARQGVSPTVYGGAIGQNYQSGYGTDRYNPLADFYG